MLSIRVIRRIVVSRNANMTKLGIIKSRYYSSESKQPNFIKNIMNIENSLHKLEQNSNMQELIKLELEEKRKRIERAKKMREIIQMYKKVPDLIIFIALTSAFVYWASYLLFVTTSYMEDIYEKYIRSNKE